MLTQVRMRLSKVNISSCFTRHWTLMVKMHEECGRAAKFIWNRELVSAT